MKYCIGCIHWYVTAHERGQVYSEYTADCDTPANLSCTKGHWLVGLDPWSTGEKLRGEIEACMEKAETCPDFTERATST